MNSKIAIKNGKWQKRNANKGKVVDFKTNFALQTHILITSSCHDDITIVINTTVAFKWYMRYPLLGCNDIPQNHKILQQLFSLLVIKKRKSTNNHQESFCRQFGYGQNHNCKTSEYRVLTVIFQSRSFTVSNRIQFFIIRKKLSS